MLKILLKNRFLALMDKFTGQSKAKKAATVGVLAAEIVLGILLLVAAAYGVSALFGNLCAALAASGYTWVFYGIAAGVAFIAALMLTMFYAQGAIFEAKDNELLLSMPIPPSAILASRMGTLYFLNFLVSFVALAAAGYTVGTKGGGIALGSVVILFLCALLLPLLSTTLTCLLGWAVSAITRRMRNKTPMQLFLSLIAVVAFYLVLNNVNGHMQAIQERSHDLAAAFRGSVYPLYALGTAIANCDWMQLLIFAAICIIPFALVVLILSKSFIKIVTARSTAKKQKYEATSLKSNGLVWALTKKDLTRFFNSAPYMLNTGLGLLYVVGLSVYSVISHNELIEGILKQATKIQNPGAFAAVIAAFVLSWLAGVTNTSGPSISVEGKNLWILKSMPLRAKEILTAKTLSHLVLAVPVSLFSSLLFLLCIPSPSTAGAVILFLMPVLANIFCALAGVISNLYFGKLDHPSIAKAAKSTSSALIPLILTTLATAGPGALFLLILRDSMTAEGYSLVAMGFLLVLDVVMYFFLGSPAAQKRWDKLSQ